jgi:hypothetical protein
LSRQLVRRLVRQSLGGGGSPATRASCPLKCFFIFGWINLD